MHRQVDRRDIRPGQPRSRRIDYRQPILFRLDLVATLNPNAVPRPLAIQIHDGLELPFAGAAFGFPVEHGEGGE
jgi:hypothetical protein